MKETFLASTCNVVGRSVVSSKCCTKDCSYCSYCQSGDSCSSLAVTLAINSTSGCCDGYKCCDTCCDKCQTCTGSGSSKSCYYRDCNCRCCSSVQNLQCTLTCKECWTPTVTMEYQTITNSTVQAKISKTCNTDYTCVDNYLSLYQLNQTSQCFYNPQNTQELATSNEYTPHKFGIMYTFAALTIISVIWLLIVLFISLGLCLHKNGFIKIEFTRNGSSGSTSAYHNATATTTTIETTTTKPVEKSYATSTQSITLDQAKDDSHNNEVYQPPVVAQPIAQPVAATVGGNGFYEPTGNEPVSQPGVSTLPYPPTNDFNPYQPFNPNANYNPNADNNQYISYGPTN